MNEQAVPRTTLGDRFLGFTVSHIVLSMLGAALVYEVLGRFSSGGLLPFVAESLLILVYFPLGAYAAFEGRWTCPTDEEKLLAVLQPALVAWAWAGLVIFSPWGGAEVLLIPAFFISVILASPSSGFVILCVLCLPYRERLAWWCFAAFLAGFLPPLLFALGSFWQSGRMERAVIASLALPAPPPAAEL